VKAWLEVRVRVVFGRASMASKGQRSPESRRFPPLRVLTQNEYRLSMQEKRLKRLLPIWLGVILPTARTAS
jgi:hypothetical protein